MGFFSKILDKTKDLLGLQSSDKPEFKNIECGDDLDQKPKEIDLTSMKNVGPHECSIVEENDAQKIYDDFVLKHPTACELFKSDLERIHHNIDDIDLLTDYWDKCNFKIDLYNGCIRDIFAITHTRSRISVKVRPEIIFDVQDTVQKNIDLVNDLIPYVIKLFIYDCKKIVFKILNFLHINKEERNISPKSIADDFVNKIAASITSRIREMLAKNFYESKNEAEFANHIHCKELEDIADIAQKYNNICQGIRNINYSLDDVVGEKYQEDLSIQIDKVIARYENRHLVDKIKDYLLILWYVLRFFYSIFFGAGFLYLIWLGNNLSDWGKNIDSFFMKAGELFTPAGAEYASELIAPMIAAALSKITLVLVMLGGIAVLVYFAYRVYSVRTKLSDIVNLNISMYAASLLDISVYKSTDKLIQDISFGVQVLLDIPKPLFISNRIKGNNNIPEERIDDRSVGMYIERISELRTLCERLIACARKNKK